MPRKMPRHMTPEEKREHVNKLARERRQNRSSQQKTWDRRKDMWRKREMREQKKQTDPLAHSTPTSRKPAVIPLTPATPMLHCCSCPSVPPFTSLSSNIFIIQQDPKLPSVLPTLPSHLTSLTPSLFTMDKVAPSDLVNALDLAYTTRKKLPPATLPTPQTPMFTPAKKQKKTLQNATSEFARLIREYTLDNSAEYATVIP